MAIVLHRVRLGIVATLACSFALSACGSHSSSPSGGLLPQATRRVASSASISGGSERFQRESEQSAGATSARSAQSLSNPSNVTTANPPVARPHEAPCVVTLFTDFQFTNFTPPTFSYSPPAACPGPWAKVVLDGDFNVSAGRQFDRTASIWIAGTNVYFGTTAEPSAHLAPSWHVERDITDLSAILRTASTGEVVLGNIVNGTYTGVISASAKLEFYPANAQNPAPAVPDDVYPLSGGTLGDNQYISSPQAALTATYTLPTNVRAAYLDVYLQSQGGDEFWYTCFPNDLAQQLPNCGNTAFREGDVAIDGRAAGVVPVYPWIYTGGIDPYLWRPVPAVDTLEFVPYRVNLTPFAGVLSDGSPHTIAVTVFNNGNYFAANGALLVYQDHSASHVTGGIISDATSLAPTPMVQNGVKFSSTGVGTGRVTVSSFHRVSIDGFVNTSKGRVETKLQQQISFNNTQQIDANTAGTLFDQNIKQDTAIVSDTTTISGEGARTVHAVKDWPLRVVYDFLVNPDGSASQYAAVTQGKIENVASQGAGGRQYRSSLADTVSARDTLDFFATGGYAPSNPSTTQTYAANDSTGLCYFKRVTAANGSVTAVVGGSC